ncbi:hypothetical protein THIOM_003480 [Candidatus Thiomargarita nelsonii]|uniref:Uncharacterized protein n=1 Tax=Candidatus Thiomargarita nelsonii TaxID=1003181 RepID=A0A176RYC7_9GAMM|nr:hypothetical protein THIOM_003480 [Candidatus Thiomargarita nelsonii]
MNKKKLSLNWLKKLPVPMTNGPFTILKIQACQIIGLTNLKMMAAVGCGLE